MIQKKKSSFFSVRIGTQNRLDLAEGHFFPFLELDRYIGTQLLDANNLQALGTEII